MAITFDPSRRPEDHLADFFAYLKQQDVELGQLLESKLQSGFDLSPKDRMNLAKQAIAILKKRAGGSTNV